VRSNDGASGMVRSAYRGAGLTCYTRPRDCSTTSCNCLRSFLYLFSPLHLHKVGETLDALGSPEQLAAEYLTDNLLARAEVSRSPAHVLGVLFRLASLSIAGFLVFVSSIAGYFLGLVLVLCALLKPIHPQTAGLWIYPTGGDDTTISLRLGFGSAPPDGRDVLGWWIVPIGWLWDADW
jgi:hypothetical protein